MTSSESPFFVDDWLLPILERTEAIPPGQGSSLQPATPGARAWDALTAAGLASDETILGALGRHFRLQRANLAEADPRVAPLVPESIARKLMVFPLRVQGAALVVATSDPRDFAAEQELEFSAGRSIVLELASPAELTEKLDSLYRPANRISALVSGLGVGHGAVIDVSDPTPEPDRDPAMDAPMAKLVDALIADGVRAGASDIHSEAEGSHVVVRYRVDGILKEVMRLPEAAGPALVRRVKIVAGLDVTNSMTPQDGRSTARVDGHVVDLRVATAPVARRGEKLVIRILNKSNLKASIPALALPTEEEEVLMKMLGHREGMLLVTGPTGSGKTTTLYAILNHLKTGRVNIVTVEDPVEYDVDGISQMQVNDAQGFTFATALKSVLRQDPDIVLVGEIRDLETATIAIQAGLTGHFVFSTLHTNDAPSAIVRLRDMGVDSFKIGSVAKGIVAQRLLRRLCEKCAAPMPVEEIPAEGRPTGGHSGAFQPRKPVGCKACSGTGYKGRIAVMELLPIEGNVPRLIETGAPLGEIIEAARPHGMRTLWESGLHRFWIGGTSFDEVKRVLGEFSERPDEKPVHDRRREDHGAPVQRERADPDAPVILLADDDAQMRRLVRTVLEREGMKVLEAADGIDALEAIDTQAIDLMLLDHDMPRLTGLGVLEELRARVATVGLPVIMLTARTDDTELEALELGAQDYLTKPVQPRPLVARVRAVLKRTGMD